MDIKINLKVGDKEIVGDIGLEPGAILKELGKADGSTITSIIKNVVDSTGILGSPVEDEKKAKKDEFID